MTGPKMDGLDGHLSPEEPLHPGNDAGSIRVQHHGAEAQFKRNPQLSLGRSAPRRCPG